MLYYVVPEDELMDLMEAQMILATLEQDGIENWDWYMESAETIKADFTPEDFLNDVDVDEDEKERFERGEVMFSQVAEKRLEYGEFKLYE